MSNGFSVTTYCITVRNCTHNPQHNYTEKTECNRLRLEAEKATRKRSKQVFDTGEIPHLWAHRVQESARNSQGNLFFRDGCIFSYGSHFPIAAHVENRKGKRAVLFTAQSYSVTTSRHMSAVRSAIPPDVPVFYVLEVFARDIGKSHARNLTAYQTDIEAALIKASCARSSWRKEHSHERAVTLRNEHNGYIRFFGLRNKPLAPIPDLDSKALADIKKREAVKIAKQAKETKRKEAERLAQLAVTIREWREGQDVHLPYDVPAMLRINGAEIETSKGVRVPLDHAKRVLGIVRKVVERKEAFVSNGHTIPIGVYKVDSIDVNGTLRAGCHVISFAEIQSVGEKLDALNG